MQPSAANVQVLIVEDDPDIGKLLAMTMRENGMTPTIAEDGHVMQSLLCLLYTSPSPRDS